MNVPQNSEWILRDDEMESRLPDRTSADGKSHGSFVRSDRLRDGSSFRDTHQEMVMVMHDDESEEEERIVSLDVVQSLDGNASTGWITEHRSSLISIRRDEHATAALHRMSLEHGFRIDIRGQ